MDLFDRYRHFDEYGRIRAEASQGPNFLKKTVSFDQQHYFNDTKEKAY